MGNMIGPLTLTVGQPFQLSLNQATRYIDVENDSPYDVWVYFGNVKPTDLTNAEQTWHRTARRDHTSLLPVEGFRGASRYEYSNNALGAFQGIVWLMAVNPGGLALTGTTSARNQIFVTPYLAGEPLPTHAARSSSVDLTSQARMFSLPIAVVPTFDTWTPSSLTSHIVGATIALTPQNIANGQVVAYLYGGYIIAQHSTFTAQLQVGAVILNGSSTVISGLSSLWWGDVWANMTNNTHDALPLVTGPAVPAAVISLSGLVNPVNIGIQALCLGTSGTPTNLIFNILWAPDQVNTTIPGGLGFAYSGLSGGTGGPY